MSAHLLSMMQCDKCAHQWLAVHPVEAEYLECDICLHMTPAPPAPDDTVPLGLMNCAICGWHHEPGDECVEDCEDDDPANDWKKND